MSSLPKLPEQQILHTQTPASHWYGYVSGYTKNQMREYGDARAAYARKQALEELIAHFECKPCGYEVFGQQIADEIKELLK